MSQEPEEIVVHFTSPPSATTSQAGGSGPPGDKEGSGEPPRDNFDITEEEITSKTKDDFVCGICLELFYFPSKLADCSHYFCFECAVKTIKTADLAPRVCPVCRAPHNGFQIDHRVCRLLELWLEKNPEYKMSEVQLYHRDTMFIVVNLGLRTGDDALLRHAFGSI
ncbi:hypothetical protein RUND412_004208 [Rhizina undulata]